MLLAAFLNMNSSSAGAIVGASTPALPQIANHPSSSFNSGSSSGMQDVLEPVKPAAVVPPSISPPTEIDPDRHATAVDVPRPEVQPQISEAVAVVEVQDGNTLEIGEESDQLAFEETPPGADT